MSGKKTCAAVVQASENRKNNAKASRTLDGIATMGISEIGRSDDTENEPAVNIINNNYKEIKQKISENRCENISNVKQYNIYVQPPTCYEAINKNCTNNKTGIPDTDCLDLLYSILDESSSKQISQININKATSICEINSSLQVLSEKDQNEENLNTIKLLQDARSKATNKQSESLNCTEINSNITKEKYIRSYLTCSNRTSVNQENLISSCTPNISLQLNDNNEMKRCLQDLGIMSEEETLENTKSDAVNSSVILTPSPIQNSSINTPLPYNKIIAQNPKNLPSTMPTTPIIQNNGIPIGIIIVVGVVIVIIIIIIIIVIKNNNNNNNNKI
jgi:hypothetical protein